MCGIFGIFTKEKSLENIKICIKSLKFLEYRGYDSSGICYKYNNKYDIFRKKGKIVNLENEIMMSYCNPTNLVIGHTRWATHGKPDDKNAHPHYSNNKIIYLVHNGIIENYDELKKILLDNNYKFYGKTDSEILANFIEYVYLNNKNEDFVDILKLVFKDIVGTYGLIIINKNIDDKIYVLRNGSPICVGSNDSKYYISSDHYSFINYCDNMIHLKDNQLMEIDINKTSKLYELDKKEFIIPSYEKIDTKIINENLGKQGFEHYMLKEISKQKESLENCMRGRIKNNKVKLGGLELKYENINIKSKLLNCKNILICACGTSLHSAHIGKYILEELTNIQVSIEQASEFRYRKANINKDTILIVVSQSGETSDTLGALRKGLEKNLLCLSICNIVGSTISREAHGGIYLHVGPEIGVASTKAFSGQICAFYMMSIYLAQLHNINEDICIDLLKNLEKIPSLIENLIKNCQENIKEICKFYKNSKHMLCLGRGFNYPVALEGSLKIKEVSYIHAEGYSAAEMKHGPIALIDENMPVIFIAIDDSVFKKVKSNIQEVKSRGGKIILITNKPEEYIKDLYDHKIVIPKTQEQLYPFLTVIPFQLLSYYLALENNCDIDKPRNLAKCVTVE